MEYNENGRESRDLVAMVGATIVGMMIGFIFGVVSQCH